MLTYLKRIGKNSLYYLLARILTAAIGFLLIPVYTRVLTPEDYGTFSIVETAVSIFMILIQVGLINTIATLYFDYYHDATQLKRFISSIIFFFFVSAFGWSAIIIMWGKPFLHGFLGDVPFNPYILLSLGIASSSVFFTFLQAIYRTQEKAITYFVISLLYFSTNLVLIIYFVVYLRGGALGNTIARFIGTGTFFVIAIYLLRHFFTPRFDSEKFKKSLAFSLPLVPDELAAWVFVAVDRLFLNRYVGLTEVGLYALGFKLSSILNFVVMAIYQAWTPFFMTTATQQGEHAKAIFSRLVTYFLGAILFLAIAISINAREIVLIFTTTEYTQAYKVVPIITINWVVLGMYFMVVNQIFYTKQTQYIPIPTVVASSIQVLLNYLWVPKYGMFGSAWAMLISQIITFLLTWYFSYKVYPMHFEYTRLIKLIFVSGFIFFIGLAINTSFLWLTIFMKMGILLIYPFLLFLIGFYQDDEILKIKEWWYRCM